MTKQAKMNRMIARNPYVVSYCFGPIGDQTDYLHGADDLDAAERLYDDLTQIASDSRQRVVTRIVERNPLNHAEARTIRKHIFLAS